MTVDISFSASNGIFNGTTTDTNGNIILGPQSLRPTFPGDTSYWSYGSTSGNTPWTVNEDSISVTVPSGSENYLEGYAVLDGGNYTQVTYRITLSGDNPDGTSNIQWTVTDSTGATIANQNPNLPTGTFNEQFTFTATATSPNTISHVTLEVFVHGGSSITASDGELLPISGGTSTTNTYGTWTSYPVDLWSTANVPITGTGLSLVHGDLYYGDLSNVDSANNTQHSIDVLSVPEMLVCNEPGNNTTSRQEYVQQQLVKDTETYGYVNLGASETSRNGCIPSETDVKAGIDRCASGGYKGVFFDGARTPGVPMDYLNEIVNYTHSKGLFAFGNTNPGDRFNTAVDTTVITPTAAPVISAVSDATSTLPAGNYQVVYTVTNYLGESTASPVSNTVTITSGQSVQLASITGLSSLNGPQAVNVYMSTTAGATTFGRVQTGSYGTQTTFNALPASGAASPPTTNTAYNANPNGIACAIAHDDWTLTESFFSESSQYMTEGGTFATLFADYVRDMQAKMNKGSKVMGLAYARAALSHSDYSDWLKAYVLAAGLGMDGLAYGNSDNDPQDSQPWASPPTFPALGNTLVLPMQAVGNNTYEAVTDEGIIQFIAQDSPVSRSYNLFAIQSNMNIAVSSAPTGSATRVETKYQTNASKTIIDDSLWTDVADLNGVSARYARMSMTLQS